MVGRLIAAGLISEAGHGLVARGCEKTVLLNAVGEEARGRGWLVISATIRPGVAQEIAAVQLPALLGEHVPDAVIRRTTGIDASVAGFGGGVNREHVDRFPAAQSLRSQLAALTEALEPHETGVLITLDEVHTAALEDLRIITPVQHAFREDREVAFVAAGLPIAVDDLLNDHVMPVPALRVHRLGPLRRMRARPRAPPTTAVTHQRSA